MRFNYSHWKCPRPEDLEFRNRSSWKCPRPGWLVLALAMVPAVAEASPWHVTLLSGAHVSDLSGRSGAGYDVQPRLSPAIVGQVGRDVGPVSLEVGVGYVERGGTSTSFLSIRSVREIGWRLRYLDVPLLVRFPTHAVRMTGPYLSLGPTLSIALGGAYEETGHDARGRDISEDMRWADLAWTVGAGASWAVGGGGVGFEARYSGGLFSPLIDEEEFRNATFALLATFRR